MLCFEVRGDGPRPTLLLHGFLGAGRNLVSLARRWCEAQPERRILLPDLTGHGSSPPLPAGADLDTMAADVLALAAAQGVPWPMEVAGHSLGGRVALAMRRRAPARVGRTWLVDISPSPIRRLAGGMQELLEAIVAAPARAPRRDVRAGLTAAGIAPPLADWAVMNMQTGADGVADWRIDRAALAACHARCGGEDLWDAVAQAPDQIACIRGGSSAYVSDADAARLRRLGAQVHTLAGAGHFVHVDALGPLVALLAA